MWIEVLKVAGEAVIGALSVVGLVGIWCGLQDFGRVKGFELLTHALGAFAFYFIFAGGDKDSVKDEVEHRQHMLLYFIHRRKEFRGKYEQSLNRINEREIAWAQRALDCARGAAWLAGRGKEVEKYLRAHLEEEKKKGWMK